MGIGMDSSSDHHHHHHHQEMCSQTLESILGSCPKSAQERKPRPADMQAINCPRCDSTNTKFCYYNNYSLSQPRYFCKSCRRYWTKGGTLRNVPVGGGCRKNKRSSSSSPSSSSKRSHDQTMTALPSPVQSDTHLSYDPNDLTLAIARLQRQSDSGHALGLDDRDGFSIYGDLNMPPHHRYHGGDRVIGSNVSPFDGLRGGGGFFENPTASGGIQGLYYGMGNVGNIRMSGAHREMGMPFEDFSGGSTMSTAVTTIKQESRSGGREGEGRAIWGFPWQSINGDANVADFDSSRSTNWNGVNGSSNWHGLLNSPLV